MGNRFLSVTVSTLISITTIGALMNSSRAENPASNFTAAKMDAALKLKPKYCGETKVKGKTRDVCLLTKQIASEPGSYYAVVAEYLNPLDEPNFVANFLRPGKKSLINDNVNGYLEELFHWITVYKLVPVNGSAKNYDVYGVRVINGKIVPNASAEKGSFSTNGVSEISFGMKSNLKINIMGENRVFNLNSTSRYPMNHMPIPMKSSWHDGFSAGMYNPGYKQSNGIQDRILRLSNDADATTRQSSARFAVKKLKGKTLNIYGDFKMNHLGMGLYTYSLPNHSTGKPSVGFEKIEDKIAVFFDVYDASPIMNTVELVLIDPANPAGSQMYFEQFGNKTKTVQIP